MLRWKTLELPIEFRAATHYLYFMPCGEIMQALCSRKTFGSKELRWVVRSPNDRGLGLKRPHRGGGIVT